MDPGATTILLFLADLIAGTQRYGKLDDRITNGQGLVVRSLASEQPGQAGIWESSRLHDQTAPQFSAVSLSPSTSRCCSTRYSTTSLRCLTVPRCP